MSLIFEGIRIGVHVTPLSLENTTPSRRAASNSPSHTATDRYAAEPITSPPCHDAGVAKFGPEGENLGMGKQADFTKQLENAKVEENGDVATITASDGKPLTLKKADGAWKVDFASMPSMDQAMKILPMMAKMAGASNELADEITAGKYATAADAKKAYGQKMMSAFMPTTQPK